MMFLKLYVSGAQRFKKSDTIFCVFRLGGISDKRALQREKEFNESRKQNGMKRIVVPHLQILAISLYYLIRRIAIAVLGEKFYSPQRGWYSDKNEMVKTHV